jgi:hypothetical protein
MQVTLSQIAYARSGDKGDGSNVGVVAYNADCYEIIKEKLTPAKPPICWLSISFFTTLLAVAEVKA